MKRSAGLALLVSPVLLGAVPAIADSEGAPQAPAPVIAPADPGAGLTAADVLELRRELERVRREAEESRRLQEERIRALERKLEEVLQAPAVQLQPAGPAVPAPAAGAGVGRESPDPPASPPPAPNPVTVRPPFRARLYGFARADVDVDSRKMFAGPHLPFWVLSPLDPRARNTGDGDFTIHPRLTRLGLDTEGPVIDRLGDAKLSGKIEIDFFNILPDRNSATSNSRAFVRMRHAYGRLDWERSHFLFGQYWDLIAPLFPAANYDVVMWFAGNLADRRPQLRFVHEPRLGRGRLSLGAMIGSPSAVDSQDLDADNVVDGEESKTPVFQARAAVNRPSWVANQAWELGLWGHRGRYEVDAARAIAGSRSWASNAVGLDLRLPLTRKLLVQGEGWYGQSLADVRGGVGQNINVVTGQVVRARGGWAEALYQVNDVYGFGGGFTIDDPINGDVVPFTGGGSGNVADAIIRTGRTSNQALYLVNRFNLGPGLLLGLDFMHFTTRFAGLPGASNNRWNGWLQHNF